MESKWRSSSRHLNGWQQVGAEAVVYQELGKRITLALLDEDARNHVQVKNST